jgi:acetylornithine deacetylase/succinyl-diaminopimelate desuccinylase family protein
MSELDLLEKLDKYIDPEAVLELSKKLISIPSHRENPNEELAVANYIRDYLKEAGINAWTKEVIDGRPNVIARFGKGNGKRLLLTGHIDTVPPMGMSDPFTPKLIDGKLYGRGIADMTSGIIGMMYALIVLNKAGIELNGEVVFLGAIDEESNSSYGTRDWAKDGHADMAIVGEPTNLQIVSAHNAIHWFEIDITGHTAHSSVPYQGQNAIYKASQIIEAVQKKLVPRLDQRHHCLTGCSTVNVGQIIGGCDSGIDQLKRDGEMKFTGIVPNKCTIYLDRRWIPGETYQNVYQELVDLVREVESLEPKCDIQVKSMEFSEKFPHPPIYTEDNHPLIKTLSSAIEAVTGKKEKPTGVKYWTDGGILQGEAGIPTVVLGPGNIEQAHGDHEYVYFDEIVKAVKIYALTAVELCK